MGVLLSKMLLSKSLDGKNRDFYIFFHVFQVYL